jgi:hypothetical protein
MANFVIVGGVQDRPLPWSDLSAVIAPASKGHAEKRLGLGIIGDGGTITQSIQ